MNDYTHTQSWTKPVRKDKEPIATIELRLVTRPELDMSTLEFDYDNPQSCWALYAIIYHTHPMFKALIEERNKRIAGELQDLYMDTELGHELEMHGGLTYYETYCDSMGNVASFKIGCDFQHYGDERYCRITDPNQMKYECEAMESEVLRLYDKYITNPNEEKP